MIDTEILEKMITYALYSPYVKNEKSVSVCILALPESGKTATMGKFLVNKGIVMASDITYTGLLSLLERFKSGELKTLLIPDLLKIFGRKIETSKNFITLLNEFMEEGIQSVYSFQKQIVFDKPVRGNMIASLTSADFFGSLGFWGKVGFITRIIPFSYKYSNESVMQIFDYIMNSQTLENPIRLRLPNKERNIKLSRESAKEIFNITQRIVAKACAHMKTELYGFRMQRNLQVLAKASALFNGRKEVIKEDIDNITLISNWINFDFNIVR